MVVDFGIPHHDALAANDGDLLAALRRLDRLLAGAVDRARVAFGAEAAGDRFRGLYIGDADLARLLGREPVTPILFDSGAEPEPGSSDSRLAWLAEAFDLSPFDGDVLLLALAPELDLRYERLYAYLQDDVTRKRPTVDLALQLLCPTADERLAAWARFLSEAPLIRHRLVELVPDPGAPSPPLLAHYLKLDEQVVNFVLGHATLDRRLTPYARLDPPHEVGAEATPVDGVRLHALLENAHENGESLRLYLQGPRGSGRRQAARAAAGACGQGLLEVATAALPLDADAMSRLLGLACREAWFQDAVLYVSEMDGLVDSVHGAHARLREVFDDYSGTLIFSGTAPWIPGTAGLGRVMPVRFGVPAAAVRAQIWRQALSPLDQSGTDDLIPDLATRFRLTTTQIRDAVADAAAHVRWHEGDGEPARLRREDVFAAARRQSGHALAALASRLDPIHRWSDLVLPDEEMGHLQELCARVVHRERVLDHWGFGRRLSRGKGVNALFSGSSGTGKTMAAEIVAAELGLDLFRVELAGVVSKYIGETEKNLDRIFAAAEQTDGIVLFDEADALFGKRSEVNDSHDRYANIEISYLLQKIEEYEGIAILATNLQGNMDQAFVRRLALTVHFPLPDERSRLAIWKQVWPADAPLGVDVNPETLASRFVLTGGNIKNVALAAAFLAAENGGKITMAHVLRAVRREYEKVGLRLASDEPA